jgi:hypothetical protein
MMTTKLDDIASISSLPLAGAKMMMFEIEIEIETVTVTAALANAERKDRLIFAADP